MVEGRAQLVRARLRDHVLLVLGRDGAVVRDLLGEQEIVR